MGNVIMYFCRTAVLVVIAIERMKYIVKRWQTGKRVGSDAIFSHQLPRYDLAM